MQVIDPPWLAMSKESTSGIPQMQLSFIFGAVQTLPVWILADSSSVRNLITKVVNNRLFFKPAIQESGDVRVIRYNGEAINLKGITVLPIALGSTLVCDEFEVVPNLSLKV